MSAETARSCRLSGCALSEDEHAAFTSALDNAEVAYRAAHRAVLAAERERNTAAGVIQGILADLERAMSHRSGAARRTARPADDVALEAARQVHGLAAGGAA